MWKINIYAYLTNDFVLSSLLTPREQEMLMAGPAVYLLLI